MWCDAISGRSLVLWSILEKPAVCSTVPASNFLLGTEKVFLEQLSRFGSEQWNTHKIKQFSDGPILHKITNLKSCVNFGPKAEEYSGVLLYVPIAIDDFLHDQAFVEGH